MHILTPALFSQKAKRKSRLTYFMWSVIVPCSNVQYSAPVSPFFLLSSPSLGKIKRKAVGARAELQPKSNHSFIKQSPIICMYVRVSDTTSHTCWPKIVKQRGERDS